VARTDTPKPAEKLGSRSVAPNDPGAESPTNQGTRGGERSAPPTGPTSAVQEASSTAPAGAASATPSAAPDDGGRDSRLTTVLTDPADVRGVELLATVMRVRKTEVVRRAVHAFVGQNKPTIEAALRDLSAGLTNVNGA
jgi:hypothetical protein